MDNYFIFYLKFVFNTMFFKKIILYLVGLIMDYNNYLYNLMILRTLGEIYEKSNSNFNFH